MLNTTFNNNIHLLFQYVEYFINRGVLGLSKELRHTVMQVETPQIDPNTTMTFDDLHYQMQVPVMPPSLVEVCGLVQICYALRVSSVTQEDRSPLNETSKEGICYTIIKTKTIIKMKLLNSICMYGCMCVCMDVWMYGCMYVCIDV